MGFKALSLVFLVAIVWTSACKPKAAGGSLLSVVGKDADGTEKAFGLLVARRLIPSPMAPEAQKRADVMQVETIMRMPYISIIECKGDVNGGKTISAAEFLDFAEQRSLRDNLMVDSNGNVVTHRNSTSKILPTTPGQDVLTTPCHAIGRLLTWDVFAQIFKDMTNFPAAEPKDADGVKKLKVRYLTAQTLFLAMRGSFDPKTPTMSARAVRIFEVGSTQRSAKADVGKLPQALFISDIDYNPCTAVTQTRYTSRWKMDAFTCIDEPGNTKRKVYQVGGSMTYAALRNTVVDHVNTLTAAVYKQIEGSSDPRLIALLDTVTNTNSVSASAASSNMGLALGNLRSSTGGQAVFSRASPSYAIASAPAPARAPQPQSYQQYQPVASPVQMAPSTSSPPPGFDPSQAQVRSIEYNGQKLTNEQLYFLSQQKSGSLNRSDFSGQALQMYDKTFGERAVQVYNPLSGTNLHEEVKKEVQTAAVVDIMARQMPALDERTYGSGKANTTDATLKVDDKGMPIPGVPPVQVNASGKADDPAAPAKPLAGWSDNTPSGWQWGNQAKKVAAAGGADSEDTTERAAVKTDDPPPDDTPKAEPFGNLKVTANKVLYDGLTTTSEGLRRLGFPETAAAVNDNKAETAWAWGDKLGGAAADIATTVTESNTAKAVNDPAAKTSDVVAGAYNDTKDALGLPASVDNTIKAAADTQVGRAAADTVDYVGGGISDSLNTLGGYLPSLPSW